MSNPRATLANYVIACHEFLPDTRDSDVPDSSRLHDVTNDELLDGLVLRDAARTVGAPRWFYVATDGLGTPVASSLRSHHDQETQGKER